MIIMITNNYSNVTTKSLSDETYYSTSLARLPINISCHSVAFELLKVISVCVCVFGSVMYYCVHVHL